MWPARFLARTVLIPLPSLTAECQSALPIHRLFFTAAKALPFRPPSLLWPFAEAQCRTVANVFSRFAAGTLSMPRRRGVPSTRHKSGGNRAQCALTRSPTIRSEWGSDPQPPPIPPGRSPVFPADRVAFLRRISFGNVKDLRSLDFLGTSPVLQLLAILRLLGHQVATRPWWGATPGCAGVCAREPGTLPRKLTRHQKR